MTTLEDVVIHEVDDHLVPNLNTEKRLEFFSVKEKSVTFAATKMLQTMPRIVGNVTEANAVAEACNNSHVLNSIDINGETEDLIITLWRGQRNLFNREKLVPGIMDTRNLDIAQMAKDIKSFGDKKGEAASAALLKILGDIQGSILDKSKDNAVVKYGNTGAGQPAHSIYGDDDTRAPGISVLHCPNAMKDLNSSEFKYSLPCKVSQGIKGNRWVLLSWEPEAKLEVATSDVIFPVKQMAGGNMIYLTDKLKSDDMDFDKVDEDLMVVFLTSLIGAMVQHSKDGVKALYSCALTNALTEAVTADGDYTTHFSNSYTKHITAYADIFDIKNKVGVIKDTSEFLMSFESCLTVGASLSPDEQGELLVKEYEVKLLALEKEKAALEIKRQHAVDDRSGASIPDDIKIIGDLITSLDIKMKDLHEEYTKKINNLDVTQIEKFKLRAHKKQIENGSADRVSNKVVSSTGSGDSSGGSSNLPLIVLGVAILGGALYALRDKIFPSFAPKSKLGNIKVLTSLAPGFTTGGDIIVMLPTKDAFFTFL